MSVFLEKININHTILYGGEHFAPTVGKMVHVGGIQFQMDAGCQEGPNAFLIPFPAKPLRMWDENIITLRSCPHVLLDMEQALQDIQDSPPTQPVVHMKANVFDAGMYTIVFLHSKNVLPELLPFIPEARRPKRDHHLLIDQFIKGYPGWTFALYCFDTRDSVRAEPIMWWYEPTNPELLFVPGLHAGDGTLPSLTQPVRTHHTITLCSDLRNQKQGKEIHYRDQIPEELLWMLPPDVIGGKNNGEYAQNGDFLYNIQDIRAGRVKQYLRWPTSMNAIL